MFAGSGRFPPVDGSKPGLAPATIFDRCEVDLGRADVAGDTLRVGSGGAILRYNARNYCACAFA
jgi:hypothetical protein